MKNDTGRLNFSDPLIRGLYYFCSMSYIDCAGLIVVKDRKLLRGLSVLFYFRVHTHCNLHSEIIHDRYV
jgi:hypothetical protein